MARFDLPHRGRAGRSFAVESVQLGANLSTSMQNVGLAAAFSGPQNSHSQPTVIALNAASAIPVASALSVDAAYQHIADGNQRLG